MKTFKYSIIIFISILITSCSKSDDSKKIQEQLNNILVHTISIIDSNYININDKNIKFEASVKQLVNNISEENLTAVRDSWKALRIPWIRILASPYGPIKRTSLKTKIDLWPIDERIFDEVKQNKIKYPLKSIQTEQKFKGFHAIECVLWGNLGTLSSTDLNPSSLILLEDLTQNIKLNISELIDKWKVYKTNFEIETIQKSNGFYFTIQNAFEEIIIGLSSFADDVSITKILPPLNRESGIPETKLEESRRSKTTKQDLLESIIGIQKIYMIDNKTKLSIAELVREKSINTHINASGLLKRSISDIEKISPSFSFAINNENGRKNILRISDNLSKLARILEDEIKPLVIEYTKN